VTWSLKWGCEKPTEGYPALGFCVYNVIVKLYKFEKYYLHLAIYKTYSFFEKTWKNKIGKVVLTIFLCILALLWIFVVFSVLIYSVIGFNVFLEKVHLEQFRIEKIPGKNSDLDLRPFFSK